MQMLSVRFGDILCVVAGIMVASATTGCDRGGAPGGPGSADRAAFLAGGSGETIQPNFFIEDFKGLRAALLKRGWKVATVAGSKDGELPGSVRATNANLVQGLAHTLASVKSGGEALLVFHSHGRQREKQWGQRSHSIVSEDKDLTGADIGFDLDTIEPELITAHARGVRVAVVDLSCYSGSTQELKGASCKVTLAADDYVSLCSGRQEERSFNSYFFNLPEKPVSLEEQFLQARRQDVLSINLPQISSRATPALAGWENYLKDADPLDTYEELKNLQKGAPRFDSRKLMGEVDRWIASQKAGDPGKLKALRSEIEAKLRLMSALRSKIEDKLKVLVKDYDDVTLPVELERRAPTTLSLATLAELADVHKDGKVPETYSAAQRTFLKAMEPKFGEFLVSNAERLTAFRGRREQYDRLIEEMEQGAGALFESERKLYELQPEPQGANPCRDFTI
jgi:hypothetical protein